MSTLFLQHSSYLNHLTPIGHPERAERARAIDRVLKDERFNALVRKDAPLGTTEQAILVHPLEHILEISAQIPAEGIVDLSADTSISSGSWAAIQCGVGGACFAVDQVMTSNGIKNVFSASRPPGHHAERHLAMGFCFLNKVAIAARYAQTKYGLERVAIVDFDVHHGNGTQDIFWADPTVMYCSTHQMPLFPGTGAASETGDSNTIVNVPMRAGSDGADFKEAMEAQVLPRVRAFNPDMIIISAGFDAHFRDPLGGLNLTEDDFFWATLALMEIADELCSSRIVSILEGGYDLEGLAKSTAAHVQALMSA
ncbi:MAG: histone deacetylase family protein [Rhodobacteraceae bacterium]|nr:histone deacetylase family protein [Paracoccaceae bacterium]